MTDGQLLAAVAGGLGAAKILVDWYVGGRTSGATDAQQIAALQLAQVQAASASQLASTELEGRLVRQIDALTAQVSSLTATVAELTRDTRERIKCIEAEADADRTRVSEAITKIGRQVDRLLVGDTRPVSEPERLATGGHGRYRGPGTTGGE